jgi:hypothetical protein
LVRLERGCVRSKRRIEFCAIDDGRTGEAADAWEARGSAPVFLLRHCCWLAPAEAKSFREPMILSVQRNHPFPILQGIRKVVSQSLSVIGTEEIPPVMSGTRMLPLLLWLAEQESAIRIISPMLLAFRSRNLSGVLDQPSNILRTVSGSLAVSIYDCVGNDIKWSLVSNGD